MAATALHVTAKLAWVGACAQRYQLLSVFREGHPYSDGPSRLLCTLAPPWPRPAASSGYPARWPSLSAAVFVDMSPRYDSYLREQCHFGTILAEGMSLLVPCAAAYILLLAQPRDIAYDYG